MSYALIVDEYVKLIEDIFLNTPFVIPVYSEYSISDYIMHYDMYEFQGILIWSLKPVTTTNEIILDNYQQFLTDNFASLTNKLPGCFIIPQFGSVRGKYAGDFTVLINIDFNLEKDVYGYYQKLVLDSFLNKHEYLMKRKNYELIPGYSIYPVFSEISSPVRTATNSIFLRRTIMIQIKYCKIVSE